MSWNYRIIKHSSGNRVYFAVHEVFYDDKGNMEHLTKDPIDIVGDTNQILRASLNKCL